jgi:hypothetical protein
MCHLIFQGKREGGSCKETRKKHIRVSVNVLKEIIEKAKTMFALMSEFNVPKQTIFSCIKSGKMEVLHPGVKSLLLHVEVILKAIPITTTDLSCTLNVSKINAF